MLLMFFAGVAEFLHFQFVIPHCLGFFEEIIEMLAHGALHFHEWFFCCHIR